MSEKEKEYIIVTAKRHGFFSLTKGNYMSIIVIFRDRVSEILSWWQVILPNDILTHLCQYQPLDLAHIQLLKQTINFCLI